MKTNIASFAHHLHQVAQFCGRDELLPVYTYLRLHVTKTELTLSSTNRYEAGHVVIPRDDQGDDQWTTYLSVTNRRQLSSLLARNQWHTELRGDYAKGNVQLVPRGDWLDITATVGSDTSMLTMRTTPDLDYPSGAINKLVNVENPVIAGFNPGFLRQVMPGERNTPTIVSAEPGHSGPVTFQSQGAAGEKITTVIMAMRLPDGMAAK